MKNIKLVVGLLFIYSCSPVITNTLPSPSSSPTKNPDITATPTSSVIPNSSISPSANVSITPSIEPSRNSNADKDFASMRILNSEGQVMSFFNSPDNKGEYFSYTAVVNEKERFICEVKYTDGTVSREDVSWSSSSNIISVDQTGLVKINSKVDYPINIFAELKSNPSKYIKFSINISNRLDYEYKDYDEYCKLVSKIGKIEKFKRLAQKTTSGLPRCSSTNYPADYFTSLATFNGKVYDPNLVPVEGATVNATSIDAWVKWTGEAQITSGGSYVFRNAPVGARVAITVTKDGWTTRTRKETLKSNLQGDPAANVFDFSSIYAIQDEPEVNQLKINGQLVNSSSKDDEFISATNSPKNSKPTPNNLDNSIQINNVGNVTSLTGVNSNTLDVEMTFSEPVRRDDIENYFRVISQSVFDNRLTSFTVDNNYSGIRFEWSKDDTVVTFKTNKAILANTKGDEARYLLDFSQSFRDKTDRSSIDRRYFRFSPSQINDFAVFSVKNDEEAPKLLGITAKDGNSNNNDILELTYSEPMELINQASFPTALVDFKDQKILSNQLISRLSNNTTTNNGNNATLLGYLDSSNGNTFKTSYMIGKILQGNLSGSSSKVEALGNTSSGVGFVKSAKIKNNTVILELDSQAFTKNDMVIVSVGKRIDGFYTDTKITKDLSVNLDSSVEFSQMYDPSGRLIDTGNSSTSANIDVNNSQRITLVN